MTRHGAPVSVRKPLAHQVMCMQAVRAVFNIAIGADSADLQRTARSALLQMLNTVVKRITMATVVRAAPTVRHCYSMLRHPPLVWPFPPLGIHLAQARPQMRCCQGAVCFAHTAHLTYS